MNGVCSHGALNQLGAHQLLTGVTACMQLFSTATYKLVLKACVACHTIICHERGYCMMLTCNEVPSSAVNDLLRYAVPADC